jgi:O-antigen/teichoic acid export membrane protein
VKHQLLKNGIYNAAAGAIRIGLALLTVPVLIRCLGLSEYGLWALVSAVLGLVTLAEGGLSTATTVFVARDLAIDDTDELAQTLTVSFSLMLGLATATALGMQFGSSTIVQNLLKLPEIHHIAAVQALQLSGWVVWTRLLQQVFIGIEQAYQRYGLLNILNTAQWTGLSLGLFFIAGQGGHTPQLMQWQLGAGIVMLCSHAYVVFNLLKHRQLKYIWNPQKAILLARQSWMTWVTTLGGALFVRGDRIIVGAQLGPEALGIYAAITDVAGAINLFSALPVQPLLPALSQHKSGGIAITAQIQQVLRLNASIALGMGVLLFTFAPWVMPFFMGNGVQPQTIVGLKIALIIYSLFSLNAIGYYALLSVGVKWGMWLSIVTGMFSLLTIAIGTSYGGLMGAIIGNAGYISSCSMIMIALHKLHLPGLLWIKTLIIPLIWFFVCIAASNFMPDQIITRGVFAISAISILIYWFTAANEINVKNLISRFAV